MQRTRLTQLTTVLANRATALFTNPWRRFALISIANLFGFFLGNAISTTAGQNAAWDVSVAALMLLITECISIFVYRRRRQPNPAELAPLTGTTLNAMKIGLAYALFLEAFKLGS
ncbi:MAG: DUF565 domain-containing protein [Cyanobacteria bacterium P01_H01_bin.15]